MRTSKKIGKARDGYVCMYESSKDLFNSTYESVCTAKETNISKIREIVDIYKSDIEEIYAWEHIGGCHKESEKGAAYPEQSTAHFEDVNNITV